MRRRRPPIPTLIVAVAAASLLAAGCGGGSPSGRSSTATSTAAATPRQSALVAFSHCMRSHGVPSFPDPNSSGEIPKPQVVAAVQSSPQAPSAQRACQHLMPSGGLGPQQDVPTRTRVADALAFARCVRARGFPNFPDPTNQGQLTAEMVTAAGIDLHQPALLRAGLACVSVTHGLLTPAAIERAVNGG